jgi:serine/threonine-protein kinase
MFASLGRGGMADVLLGAAQGPKGFNKLVVVKRLRALLAEDPAMVNMFLDEARLAARLSHPNVINTYEIGEEQGIYFIVMEYLDGRPLHEIIDALKQLDRRLPPQVWAKIVAEALAGLHHAHELCDYDGTPLGVVHRDVSPQNIIVTFDGRVKLVDFGIAKAAVNITRTESGIVKGKLAYMAPEQAQPTEADLDRRADIFAMGIVLWECLTMRRLITGTPAAAANKIVDMEFKAPSLLAGDVPKALDAIALRALERDPAKRYQTAEEMRDALEGYIQSTGRYVREDEIGRPIAQMFEEQREDVREQIRHHMANLGSARDLLVSGTVGPDDMTQSGPISGSPAADIKSLPKIEITDSARSVRAVNRNALWAREARATWGVRALVAAGTAVLVVSGFVVVRERERSASADADASLAPAGSAMIARAPVRVALKGVPAEATITLDDAPLANPFTGVFARDALEHRVRVACPGFTTESRLVHFDTEEVSLEVALQRVQEADAAAAVAPTVKPTPITPRTGPVRPPGSARPKLDEDPWK